ncbi:MAG TPA: hypothetical protein PKC43_10900 [Phycisphaerales bacterium]|nr:hypothetical protein [Phycisphaerales bacterium]HMP37941.1 hypothetical protein [Phycisphaerales bacterium]
MERVVATPPDQMIAARCFAVTALCLAWHDREGAGRIEPAVVSLLRAGHRHPLDLFVATLVEARRRVDGEAAAARAAALVETTQCRPC